MTNGIGIIKIFKHVFSPHITPFRIQNAQRGPPFSLITAHKVGVLNEKRCKTPLGRWNIHNHVETALKIKYANEDNCGVSCHNSANTTQHDEFDHDDQMYMMGFESTHN